MLQKPINYSFVRHEIFPNRKKSLASHAMSGIWCRDVHENIHRSLWRIPEINCALPPILWISSGRFVFTWSKQRNRLEWSVAQSCEQRTVMRQPNLNRISLINNVDDDDWAVADVCYSILTFHRMEIQIFWARCSGAPCCWTAVDHGVVLFHFIRMIFMTEQSSRRRSRQRGGWWTNHSSVELHVRDARTRTLCSSFEYSVDYCVWFMACVTERFNESQ